MVEIVTVVAIISILLGLTLPGVTSMWRQRNEATAATLIRGLLKMARVQAIRGGEHGLLFFLDEEGHQLVAFIEADPPDHTECSQDTFDCSGGSLGGCCDGDPGTPCVVTECISEPMAGDRFRVVEGAMRTIPAPYRAAPGWVIETDDDTGVPLWLADLANDSFAVSVGISTPRYQRNYFAVIFGSNGQLRQGRYVLVHDPDNDDATDPGFGFGDLTGLPVATVNQYWTPGAAGASNIGPNGADVLYGIVRLPDGLLANFVSAGQIVVYDEAAMDDLSDIEMYDLLVRESQPFYVSRYTGDIIRGPRGEG